MIVASEDDHEELLELLICQFLAKSFLIMLVDLADVQGWSILTQGTKNRLKNLSSQKITVKKPWSWTFLTFRIKGGQNIIKSIAIINLFEIVKR